MTDEQYLVASGGLCAPIAPMYDPWAPAWTHADPRWGGWPQRYRVDTWVAPRLTGLLRFVIRTTREVKLRLGVLLHGLPERDYDEDDW